MLEGLDFHRGLRNWIASFMWGGRWTLAFFDRDLGRWSWAKADSIDPMTRGEIEVELTEKLKVYLADKGLIKRSPEDHKGESNEEGEE